MTLFTPTYYQIVITNPNQNGQSAPNDGFVDAVGISGYISVNSDNLPSNFTYVMSLAKKRAGRRYRQIVQQLQLMTNAYVSKGEVYSWGTYASIVAPGASYQSESTSISITVSVDRGDSTLATLDENNAGVTLTGLAALKRCVARALVMDMTYVADVFDPTKLSTPGSATQLPRFGSRIVTLTVGKVFANLAAAEAAITVTSVAAP